MDYSFMIIRLLYDLSNQMQCEKRFEAHEYVSVV